MYFFHTFLNVFFRILLLVHEWTAPKSVPKIVFLHILTCVFFRLPWHFTNEPPPRFPDLLPCFLLRGFLRWPILVFEHLMHCFFTIRKDFQESSSRIMRDDKLSEWWNTFQALGTAQTTDSYTISIDSPTPTGLLVSQHGRAPHLKLPPWRHLFCTERLQT